MRTILLVALAACSSKSDRPPPPAAETVEGATFGSARKDQSIERIAISANGRVAVAVASDGAITRIEIPGGALKPLPPNEDVRDIALSADGSSIAIVTREKLTVDGVDVALGKEQQPTRVAFKPDGTLVVFAVDGTSSSYSDDVHVLVLDAKRAVVSNHHAIYTSDGDDCELELDARAEIALAGNCFGTRAIRIRDGAQLGTWRPSGTNENGGIAEIAPGQYTFGNLVGEDEPKFIIWRTGMLPDKELPSYPCRLSPTGRIVACERETGDLVVLDTKTQIVRQHTKLPVAVRVLRFTRDGSHVVAGLEDGRFTIVDTTAVNAAAPAIDPLPAVLAVDPNAMVAAEAPVKKVKPVVLIALDDYPTHLVEDPSGKRLAVEASQGGVTVDLAKRTKKFAFDRNEGIGSPEVTWSPDGASLAIAEDSDKITRLRVIASDGESEPRDENFEMKEAHVAWSTKNVIATGGPAYGSIQIWDATTLAKLRVLAPPTKQWLGGLAFAPDGRLLAWGDWAPTMIWDPATGVGKPLAGQGSVYIAAWSRDGSRLATVGHDEVIVVWDGATLAPISTLRGMSAFAIAFSPDGTRLATSDMEGVVVWNVADGKPVVRLVFKMLRPKVLAWPGAQIIVATDTDLAQIAVP